MADLNYSGNVAKLLEIGEPENLYVPEEWPDYPDEYSLTQADIPELIRLATDKDLFFSESAEGEPEDSAWGLIHAQRALGQLKAVEAVKPLIEVLKWEEDATLETLPSVFGLVGREAIPDLAKVLDEWYSTKYDGTALPLVDSLEKIAINYPDTTGQVTKHLLERLKRLNKNHESLNGALIASLTDLKAEKALPVIEEAFKKDLVDTMITRWHTVQQAFGLISQAEFDQAEKNYREEMQKKYGSLIRPPHPNNPGSAEEENPDPYRGGNRTVSVKKQRDKAKAKRKLAKASQKKNRKK